MIRIIYILFILFMPILTVNISRHQNIKSYSVLRNLLKDTILNHILYSNTSLSNANYEHIYPKSLLMKNMHDDMHNIFLADKNINSARSNYRFTHIRTGTNISNNFICHKKRLFHPRDNDKGIIARTLLYMSDRYNLDSMIDKKILLRWSYYYKPTQTEYIRNRIIYRLQGIENKYITNSYKNNGNLRGYRDTTHLK